MTIAGRDLLLLGILRDADSSAYRVARAMNMHGVLHRSLAKGNTYQRLQELAREGLVLSREEPGNRGPRGTKTVYSLTAAGRRACDRMLAAVLCDAQATEAELEVALVLLESVPPERRLTLLESRFVALRAQRDRLQRLYGTASSEGAASVALSHATHRIVAECDWVKRAIATARRAARSTQRDRPS